MKTQKNKNDYLYNIRHSQNFRQTIPSDYFNLKLWYLHLFQSNRLKDCSNFAFLKWFSKYKIYYVNLYRSQIFLLQYSYPSQIYNQKMNKTQILAVLAICLSLYAFTQSGSDISSFINQQTNLQKDPPKTVPYVNLTRYLGAWYEQASIPAYFEFNCDRTFANYSFNDDGTIRVDNECYRNGKLSKSIGKAYPDPADTAHTNAKLKVKFPAAPVAGDYWIVRLDDSYSYVVVSSPTYQYLWILYRSPVMAEQFYQTIVQDLKKDGFPVQKLRRTKM